MNKDAVKAKVIDHLLMGRTLYIGGFEDIDSKIWTMYTTEPPATSHSLFSWRGEHEWWSDITLREALWVIDRHWDERIDAEMEMI